MGKLYTVGGSSFQDFVQDLLGFQWTHMERKDPQKKLSPGLSPIPLALSALSAAPPSVTLLTDTPSTIVLSRDLSSVTPIPSSPVTRIKDCECPAIKVLRVKMDKLTICFWTQSMNVKEHTPEGHFFTVTISMPV